MRSTSLTHKPVRRQVIDGLGHDSEVLSAALNDVLEEQAGRVFASRLQWLFRTAAAVRAGDEPAVERLVAYLRGVPRRVGRADHPGLLAASSSSTTSPRRASASAAAASTTRTGVTAA